MQCLSFDSFDFYLSQSFFYSDVDSRDGISKRFWIEYLVISYIFYQSAIKLPKKSNPTCTEGRTQNSKMEIKTNS